MSGLKYLAPTPWRLEGDPNHRHWRSSISIYDAEGGEIAVFMRGYERDENNDGCESFTNARLCAAAPDLLEALKLFTSASMGETRPTRGESFIGWQTGDGLTARERLKIARAAIIKATGVQN